MLSRIFVLKACINISNQMIVIVVANHDLLYFAVFAHLAPEVFVESIEVILQLRSIHFIFWVVGWVLVQVGEEDSLRVGRLDMLS